MPLPVCGRTSLRCELHLNVREDRSQRTVLHTEVQKRTPNSRDCADYEYPWRPTVSKRAAHHAFSAAVHGQHRPRRHRRTVCRFFAIACMKFGSTLIAGVLGYVRAVSE